MLDVGAAEAAMNNDAPMDLPPQEIEFFPLGPIPHAPVRGSPRARC